MKPAEAQKLQEEGKVLVYRKNPGQFIARIECLDNVRFSPDLRKLAALYTGHGIVYIDLDNETELSVAWFDPVEAIQYEMKKRDLSLIQQLSISRYDVVAKDDFGGFEFKGFDKLPLDSHK